MASGHMLSGTAADASHRCRPPGTANATTDGEQQRKVKVWGVWVAQSVEHPTSAQVMISQFVSSSPASGSVLMAQSLEPASDSVSPSLSLCPPVCLPKINKHYIKIKKKKKRR